MKKKLMFLILTLAFTLVCNQLAFAACTGNNSSGSGKTLSQGQNWIPLVQKLNLSGQQVKQLKEINLSTYQSTKALRIKLLDTKFELRQLGIEGTDKAAIDAKTKEINDLKAQIQKIHQEKRQKVQSILTPEQLSKLKEMKSSGNHCGRDTKNCS